jgi:hypothetical protein
LGAETQDQAEAMSNFMPICLCITTASVLEFDVVREKLTNHLKWPVVVTMPVMRMMQSTIHQIIHVVAMWNGGVATVRTVDVLPVVAFGSKRAFVRIEVADRDDVLIHVIAVWMMQMAVLEIIHVPAMHDGDMPATLAVDMRMLRMSFAGMGFIHKFWSLVWFFMCAAFSKRLNHSGGGRGKKSFCKRLALIL